MLELVNEKVKHKKFGNGTITGLVGDGKIIVEFNELGENKKFEYPDVFESFLIFEDALLQEKTLEILQHKKVRIILEKEEQRLEFNKQYEEHKKEEQKLLKKSKKSAK